MFLFACFMGLFPQGQIWEDQCGIANPYFSSICKEQRTKNSPPQTNYRFGTSPGEYPDFLGFSHQTILVLCYNYCLKIFFPLHSDISHSHTLFKAHPLLKES